MRVLKGIITALLTPINENEEIMEESLREIVEFQISKGVDGLFVCGTTGQGPLLSLTQRKRVLETVVEESHKRIPVIAQVGLPDTASTVELAVHAEDQGADSLACVTPYYYRYDEVAMLEHYKALTRHVSIPVFIYNIPRLTGFNVHVGFLKQLARIKRIVGVKDSSRDFMQLLEFRRSLPRDFAVINGTDSYVLPALLSGIDGAVSALSNAFPELFVRLYSLYRQGRIREAATQQALINALRDVLSEPTIAPIHEALRIRGMNAGVVKRPLRQLTQEEKRRLRSTLVKLHLMSVRQARRRKPS